MMDLTKLYDPRRLAVLDRLDIMHTGDEASFDRLTRLTARYFHSAYALIVLLDDRHAFIKSTIGADPPWGNGRVVPVMNSWCRFVVANEKPMAVDDATVHPLVRESSYVGGGARSYLGVPLVVESETMGALCVVHNETHGWTPDEQTLLDDLGHCVASEMTLRRALRDALAAEAALHGYAQRYRELSMLDGATQLYNRRAFLELGAESLRAAIHHGDRCALLFVDIDGLKSVNDNRGHAVGDRLIYDASQVLRSCFRGNATVARIGGDEFAILALGCSEDGQRIAKQRIHTAVDEFNRASNRPYVLSVSVGSVALSDEAEDLDALLRSADAMMYEAKRAKRSVAA